MIRETFAYHEYAVTEVRESHIAQGKTYLVDTGVNCPRCSTVNPPLKHGGSTSCIKCGLHLERWSNGLVAMVENLQK